MSSAVYEVQLKSSAKKEIKSLDAQLTTRVIRALRSLAHDPRPHGCRKLVGSLNRWRIRVGDYRILYSINDRSRLVEKLSLLGTAAELTTETLRKIPSCSR